MHSSAEGQGTFKAYLVHHAFAKDTSRITRLPSICWSFRVLFPQDAHSFYPHVAVAITLVSIIRELSPTDSFS